MSCGGKMENEYKYFDMSHLIDGFEPTHIIVGVGDNVDIEGRVGVDLWTCRFDLILLDSRGFAQIINIGNNGTGTFRAQDGKGYCKQSGGRTKDHFYLLTFFIDTIFFLIYFSGGKILKNSTIASG